VEYQRVNLFLGGPNIKQMAQKGDLTHLYRFPIILPRYDGKTPTRRGALQLYSSRHLVWLGLVNWSALVTVLAVEADV